MHICARHKRRLMGTLWEAASIGSISGRHFSKRIDSSQPMHQLVRSGVSQGHQPQNHKSDRLIRNEDVPLWRVSTWDILDGGERVHRRTGDVARAPTVV